MNARGSIIAALLVVEFAIIGEVVVAARGRPATTFARATASTASARLVDGGAHRMFSVGLHPKLTVDIGYADLTILTGAADRIDASLRGAQSSGMFGGNGPIVAHHGSDAIAIAEIQGRGVSAGDDRMVTVVVPPGTEVTVASAGDIVAHGLRAAGSFDSKGAGTITIENYAAPTLHVAARGRIALRTIVVERLDGTSRGGTFEGSGLNVRDGSVESNGRVSLGFAPGADTLVTAESGNGNVGVVGLRAAATLGTGGQSVRVGAGRGHLDVHASDGNILLAQEAERNS